MDAGLRRRNKRVGLIGLGIALGMLGLGFAAVPLYRIFCQVTGYGGTTQVASEAKASTVKMAGKPVSIRFDSNVAPGMPWSFRPEQVTQQVRIGERDIAFYIARNDSDEALTGQASYNVQPEQTAAYFNKIQCFCFTRQTLRPHEKVRMPVTYYVDPEMLRDKDVKDVEQITLSYTFYKLEEPVS
jgi:cytochrome c oxidase assembly protein subunit 11